MKRKLFVCLLAVCMVLSLCSVTALSVGAESTENVATSALAIPALLPFMEGMSDMQRLLVLAGAGLLVIVLLCIIIAMARSGKKKKAKAEKAAKAAKVEKPAEKAELTDAQKDAIAAEEMKAAKKAAEEAAAIEEAPVAEEAVEDTNDNYPGEEVRQEYKSLHKLRELLAS